MCDMARARNFFERLTKTPKRISILDHQGIRKKKKSQIKHRQLRAAHCHDKNKEYLIF
jgi:hypothetical protein